MRVATLKFEQITPSIPFFTRGRNEILNSLDRPSEEPKGYLDTNKGKAHIQFLTASDELAEDAQLGKRYFGPGIYVLNYYKPGGDIPIWVIEEPNRLSVLRAKTHLETIKTTIENEDLNNSSAWTLDGKKNKPLGINDYRVQYPFNLNYLLN